MNVLFLDYDGVVNNIIWDPEKGRADYSHPFMGKVNNWQAVQWISEFCEKYNYKIVATSTWRLHPNYKECLIAGGLRNGIEILGCTKRLDDRGEEILNWLEHHPGVEQWLVIDDEDCFQDYPEILKRFVQCTHNGGFNYEEYHMACHIHEEMMKTEQAH